MPPSDMKELAAGTNCTVIGWGKKEDKNCKFLCEFMMAKNSYNERLASSDVFNFLYEDFSFLILFNSSKRYIAIDEY